MQRRDLLNRPSEFDSWAPLTQLRFWHTEELMLGLPKGPRPTLELPGPSGTSASRRSLHDNQWNDDPCLLSDCRTDTAVTAKAIAVTAMEETVTPETAGKATAGKATAVKATAGTATAERAMAERAMAERAMAGRAMAGTVGGMDTTATVVLLQVTGVRASFAHIIASTTGCP